MNMLQDCNEFHEKNPGMWSAKMGYIENRNWKPVFRVAYSEQSLYESMHFIAPHWQSMDRFNPAKEA